MKKAYIKPDVDICLFEVDDVISTSIGTLLPKITFGGDSDEGKSDSDTFTGMFG